LDKHEPPKPNGKHVIANQLQRARLRQCVVIAGIRNRRRAFALKDEADTRVRKSIDSLACHPRPARVRRYHRLSSSRSVGRFEQIN
jgi:hypothetical protein